MFYIYWEIFNFVNFINLVFWKRDFKFYYMGEKLIDYIEIIGEEVRWCIYIWKNVYICIFEMIFLVFEIVYLWNKLLIKIIKWMLF